MAETGLEPLSPLYNGLCANFEPQIIQFPPVFEVQHRQKSLNGHVVRLIFRVWAEQDSNLRPLLCKCYRRRVHYVYPLYTTDQQSIKYPYMGVEMSILSLLSKPWRNICTEIAPNTRKERRFFAHQYVGVPLDSNHLYYNNIPR